MSSLPPWANSPFELMVHAETHLRSGDDFDRSIAMIGFDNAIEVAITTYLTLHPIQRGGRLYSSKGVEEWIINYHTKLDFLEEELQLRKLDWLVERSHIVWAHDHRNEQYHGRKGVPDIAVLEIVRTAALWVFSVLFDVSDAKDALDQAVLDRAAPALHSRERRYDVAIDELYGIIVLGEQSYYASELLFAVDYDAYRDIGGKLADDLTDTDDETEV